MIGKKIMYWLPRLLCIAAIIFVTVLGLAIVWNGDNAWDKAGVLLPAILMGAVLVYAWKHERAGGIIFTVLGALFTVLVILKYYFCYAPLCQTLGIALAVPFPFLIVGILFLIQPKQK